jgi:hypothetical protein
VASWRKAKRLHASTEYQEATSKKFYTQILIYYCLGWIEENEMVKLKEISKKITHGEPSANSL